MCAIIRVMTAYIRSMIVDNRRMPVCVPWMGAVNIEMTAPTARMRPGLYETSARMCEIRASIHEMNSRIHEVSAFTRETHARIHWMGGIPLADARSPRAIADSNRQIGLCTRMKHQRRFRLGGSSGGAAALPPGNKAGSTASAERSRERVQACPRRSGGVEAAH
jgi:hypothetical protein